MASSASEPQPSASPSTPVLRYGCFGHREGQIDARRFAQTLEAADLKGEAVLLDEAFARKRAKAHNQQEAPEHVDSTGVEQQVLEEALQDRRIDVAYTDYALLPTRQAEGLMVGAVSERMDPAEVLLSRSGFGHKDLAFGLPAKARVSYHTRRQAMQLRALRPDLELVYLTGRCQERYNASLAEGQCHAMMASVEEWAKHGAAVADLEVLRLDPQHFIPAPAQGVLAYQWRKGDQQTGDAVMRLHHADTVLALRAERKLLSNLLRKEGLGATRQNPVQTALAAYCREEDGLFHFHLALGQPLQAEAPLAETPLADAPVAATGNPRRIRLRHFDPEVLVVEAWHKLHAPAPERVFVSRNLEADGVFARAMEAHAIQWQAMPLTPPSTGGQKPDGVPSPERAILTDAGQAETYLAHFPDRKQDPLIACGEDCLQVLRRAGAGRVFALPDAADALDELALVEAVFSS